ncbi:MAG: CPBP family intramembrane glutamic endopeptidase [Candidatus Thorarchaeota archaeon]
MKKFGIVEIEDSYLNFFTPAVLIAVGLFLQYLFSWPLSFINILIYESDRTIDLNLLGAIIANVIAIIICFVVYFIFIPRLKVQDTEFEDITPRSLLIVGGVFLVVLFFRIIISFFFEYFGITVYLVRPWFINSYILLSDPLIRALFLSYQFILLPIYVELLYRRTIIPLLEDRGSSPFLAVILSSLGFCLLFLPEYMRTTNYPGTAFWFISTFLFGLATGLVYILTRNVLFSILYSILYYVYRYSGELGPIFNDELLITVNFLLSVFILFSGLILVIYVILILLQKESSQKWVNVIKTQSAPKISRGIIGYTLISLGLVIVQLTVAQVITTLFSSDIFLLFAVYTLFYLIAFSIPFWLSITSEYAQY